MNSFDILAKDTKLPSRLFLEASAGTGKTFTIEHLVVRLLIETPQTLDQILVVTFTRAATRELKERIRANLAKEQSEKIKTALLNFERAQIFTIHGFCQRLLQEFAFEASVGLDLKEWDRDEEKWAILEFLRTSQSLSPQQLRRLLGFCQNEIETLVQKLQSSSTKQGMSFEEILKKINAQLPSFPVSKVFADIRDHYKGMTSPDFDSQALLLEKKELSPEDLDRLIGAEEIFLERLDLKARAKISGHPLMEQLQKSLWPLLEEARNPRKILQTLAKSWHEEKKKLSRQNEKISPDDLLEMVQERISDESFVAQVRKKYTTVIVDEFQDTDPIQWNIFETLFVADRSKSIYLVGDPKQSIYAFRKADIYTYLEAAKQFEQKAMLTTNFRSGEKLITSLNRLFCSQPWLDLPKLQQSLLVPPVNAAKKEGGELCFMVAEDEMGRSKRWPTPELERSLIFPFIVHEIGRLQLKPSEIAILVKDRYQALRVKKYLDQWEIPAVLYRSASLAESLAVNLLQEVIEACFGHEPLSAIKKILLGPFAQMPMEEMTDEIVFQTKMVFAELTEIWIKQGFAPFFAQFLKTSLWKETVLSCITPFYNDLMQIIEKIVFLRDPSQILKALQEIKIMETDDRISAHPHGIQIMTTHASKGLEFETVFALGVASRTNTSEDPQEFDAEKMRQLYVALTRAKTRLYVPLLHEKSGKPVPLGEASPMELFWQKVSPNLHEFTHVHLNQIEFVLKPFQAAVSPIISPSVSLLSFKPLFLQSFSSLAHGLKRGILPQRHREEEVAQRILCATSSSLCLCGKIPPGAETGVIIHAIFERLFDEKTDLSSLIAQEVLGTHLEGYEPAISAMIEQVLNLPLDRFCLSQVKYVLPEVEFLFPTQDGYLKGFIDLCFEYNGKYYLVDWKTNVLDNYTPESVEKAMIENDYLLQGEIYTNALKRYLHLFGDLTFGGAFFIFVRGPAIFEVPYG